VAFFLSFFAIEVGDSTAIAAEMCFLEFFKQTTIDDCVFSRVVLLVKSPKCQGTDLWILPES